MRGRNFWVAQDGRAVAEDPVSWDRPDGSDVHLCRRRVQRGADAHAGGSGLGGIHKIMARNMITMSARVTKPRILALSVSYRGEFLRNCVMVLKSRST
jgi:hypothetical protein